MKQAYELQVQTGKDSFASWSLAWLDVSPETISVWWLRSDDPAKPTEMRVCNEMYKRSQVVYMRKLYGVEMPRLIEAA